MKKVIVLASNNAHKLDEIRRILGDDFDVKSLKDIQCLDDIPETGDTFRDNALQKAQYVKEHYGFDCFADDSGLECNALGGQPGVHSARYASLHTSVADHDSEANMNVLMQQLEDKADRSAQFKTVIALIYQGETHFFEGEVKGRIISEKRGDGGFGYDPIFVPDGYDQTFAELGNEVKNTISHRAKAVAKLAEYLINA